MKLKQKKIKPAKKSFPFGKAFAISLSGAVCLCLILCAVLSAFAVKAEAPEKLYSICALVATAVSTAAASLLLARLMGKKGILCGAFLGAVFFAIEALGMLFISPAGFSTVVIRLVLCLLCGALGGFAGVRI